ncbi:hypothetical protein NDU88_009179 [Pleurodeles waltl]|uniref:Transmembrane protein n=1 Tax=Pleurodeles waltl TaxID=8319 RepID=A0AAV7QQT4_PLEWA|nr:hypothetical protein NDU88_009179 [Pleurodeles waltl]
MDFRLQRKKKEQKKWPVVVTALLTPVAAIVLTTILIVYKDDIHIPWLDQEHYIPKNGQAANMTPDQVREFQRWAMRYQNILLVESGFRRMARRYRHEGASSAWRAFPQGGPTLPTTATASTTTNPSQVAPPTAATVGPTSAGLPGPSIATGAGQPTRPGTTPTQTSSTGTQTTTAPSADPAAFNQMDRKMDKVLRKLSHLSRVVRHINCRVKSIKRTLRKANL